MLTSFTSLWGRAWRLFYWDFALAIGVLIGFNPLFSGFSIKTEFEQPKESTRNTHLNYCKLIKLPIDKIVIL